MEIIEYLTAQGITLNEFAERCGLKQSLASQYKNRRKRPSPEKALRIEEATGGAVSRMELLYPENQKRGLPAR